MPWVEHQFLKQDSDGELLIIDSSAKPWVSEFAEVSHVPHAPGIAEKRTIALSAANSELVTWFDDDDWQLPTKLGHAHLFAQRYTVDAVGSRHGQMYSTLTGKCANYTSRYEPIIFNSAVYRKSAVPESFAADKVTGEDTEWHDRFFRHYPTFITLREPMHAWLCHNKNITNKASSRFFDQACEIPFDEWELDFLRRLHT